jgi:hypothetical protein
MAVMVELYIIDNKCVGTLGVHVYHDSYIHMGFITNSDLGSVLSTGAIPVRIRHRAQAKPCLLERDDGCDKYPFNSYFVANLSGGVIHSKEGECPAPIVQEIVDAFHANDKPTPKEHLSLFDWNRPFMASWNAQAVYLLADSFKKEIEAGQHLSIHLDLKNYPDDQLVKWCISKLISTQQEYLDTLPLDPHLHEMPEEKIARLKQKKSTNCDKNKRRSHKTKVLHAFSVDD